MPQLPRGVALGEPPQTVSPNSFIACTDAWKCTGRGRTTIMARASKVAKRDDGMTNTLFPPSGSPHEPAMRQVDYSITHLTHVRRRHYGRWAAAALILIVFGL